MRPAMLSGLLSAGVPFPKAVELADPSVLPEKFKNFIALAFELGTFRVGKYKTNVVVKS